MAWGILVPQPGIKPMPSTVEAPSLNHWTTREVLSPCYPTVTFLSTLLTISSSPVAFLLVPPQFLPPCSETRVPEHQRMWSRWSRPVVSP